MFKPVPPTARVSSHLNRIPHAASMSYGVNGRDGNDCFVDDL